ncbi:MAG: DEAD/DEAH box helicase [Promethearchaeati archaeon]
MVSKISKKSQFFESAFLKDNKIHYREYQDNIIKKCGTKNTLVVVPTGLGKTIIGILLITKRLKKYPYHGKILILAPTRPLVDQHHSSCVKFIDIDSEKIISLTGKIPPEKRLITFKKAQIIISTPQVLKNDIMRGRYDLNNVSLIIFDECHRTVGNYAYTFLSKEYMKSCTDPLILGLTASPGKDFETIQQLCDNLYVENVVFKTYKDEDVKDYINDIDIILEPVDLPIKIIEISQILDNLFNNFLRFFIDRNLINPYKRYYSKLDFLRIAQDLTFSLKYGNLIDEERYDGTYLNELNFTSPKIIEIVRENDLNIHSIYSYCSSCISVLHAKDLLETQDIRLFLTFVDKMKFKADQDNLSTKRIITSDHFKLINSIITKNHLEDLSHPKLDKLITLIKEEISEFKNNKILIFTQYRETAEILKNMINEEFGNKLVAEKFVGQASKIDDRGFTQTEQIEILNKFRNGEINILTATSVAEEGLDIPNVDAIVFYEPVASEIRYIQRRGRTGRTSSGRCYILIANDTVDIPFFRVSERKEKTMNNVLSDEDQLDLADNIDRQKINFNISSNEVSDFDLIKNFKERREKEKELLANRSIEEILEKLDKFSESKKYNNLKNYGVTFFTDVAKIDKNKVKEKVLKMKGKNNKNKSKQRKRYLNNNVKTLIQLVQTYSENNQITISKLKELATVEEIEGKKFYIHLNRAVYLGYLKKGEESIASIKEL